MLAFIDFRRCSPQLTASFSVWFDVYGMFCLSNILYICAAAADSGAAAPPITVVFVRVGFGTAVHVINAVLLTAALSATNSCFYASSRMLLSLSREGHAPRVFGWVIRHGVPVPALL